MIDGAPPGAPDSPGLRVPAVIGQKAAGLVGREWALRQVADWLDTGTERLFLLTGEPGSGKSVLAGWLAGAGPSLADDPEHGPVLERVRAAWSAACFCMTRGQDGADITPAWFVTSLVKQLAARHQAFTDAFLRVNLPELVHQEVENNSGTVIGHIGDLDVRLPDARDRYAQGVVEPLRALAEAHPDRTVAILVDGVDEAFVGPEPTVVSLLARSGSLPGNVRFLVTSRNERTLVTLLQDAFGDVRRLDLSTGDDAARNEDDIRLFVRQRLAAAGEPGNDEVVEHLARQAAGNFLFIDFLLDELAKGSRSLTDEADLPTGLADLYRQYLQRIVPGSADRDRGPAWGDHYQPLLGSISVALPAAPADRLLRWLDWDDENLSRFLQVVEQVTEWEPNTDPEAVEGGGGGGWRLYHRSMADFLATRHLDDRGSENRFYVAPPKQHDRIVRHYQKALAELWGGDWANCDDGYCLRNLVRHMSASSAALERPADRAGRTGELFGVVLDAGFRARQQAVPGGPEAMYDDVRTAIEVGLAPPPPGADDPLVRLITSMAVAPEVELRGLAAEALVRLAANDQEKGTRRAVDTLVTLLASESPDAWRVALKTAAALPGPSSAGLEVFRRAAIDDREPLRQAAGLYAYLRWRPNDPDCLPNRLLADLAPRVTIKGQILHKDDRLVLDFLAGLSILIYINHPDRPDVVTQTGALWHEVLKKQLKLHLLNVGAFVKVATPVVAQVYSRRVLDAALFSGLQDPAEFFASERAPIGTVIPLVDPAVDISTRADDLAAILQSPLALSRMVGSMVLAIHAFHDPDGTDPFVRELFARLDDTGRRWALWAYTVLIEKAPTGWTGLLEDLTRTFVEENQAAFLAADGGTQVPFDIDLLPLGLAYGKQGAPMAYFRTLLTDAAASADADPALLQRVVRGLAAVGFYFPQAVLETLRESVPQLLDPKLEDSLATTLATIRVLHSDTVDLFLRDIGASDQLRRLVTERGDIELVRRYIVWIGFYNNGVHQGLFHPKMRAGLLAANLKALATAKNDKALIRKMTPGPMTMAREADYRLERWVEPWPETS